MRDMKIGAPGYILLDCMARDMEGTLKKVADLGYDGIEITGFFGKPADEIRRACENANITPFGCFVSATEMLRKESIEGSNNWGDFAYAFTLPGATPEEAVSYIKEIGCEYVGLLTPNVPLTEELLEDIRLAGALLETYGMKLQYHNHNYEFINMEHGKYRMEQILEAVPEHLLFEPDLGWMEIGGADSEAILQMYANRIEVVHLKDYYRAGKPRDWKESYVFRPTGYGSMRWETLIPLCETLIQPKWYVPDHDKSYENSDIFEELKMSLDFVKNSLKYC